MYRWRWAKWNAKCPDVQAGPKYLVLRVRQAEGWSRWQQQRVSSCEQAAAAEGLSRWQQQRVSGCEHAAAAEGLSRWQRQIEHKW